VTDYANLVRMLYAKLGKWQEVADVCNRHGQEHSPGYFWSIAKGKIKQPAKGALRGIREAFAEQEGLSLAVKDTRPREGRGGLTCRRSTWLGLRELKTRIGYTWDELLYEALEMLRERYE
jgi:hypothetical protein